MSRNVKHWIQRAYILAGGKSSRFGSPKGFIDVGGITLIERLCQRLQDRSISPTIVAQRREDFTNLSWPCIEDELADAGPLHGVERSLMDCLEKSQSHCWILTCDLWDWNPAWEDAVSNLPPDSRNDFYAILMKTDDLFVPFPGVYAVSGLNSIQDAWSQGIRSLRSWQAKIHDRIEYTQIIKKAYPQTFNTPDELAKLRSL